MKLTTIEAVLPWALLGLTASGAALGRHLGRKRHPRLGAALGAGGGILATTALGWGLMAASGPELWGPEEPPLPPLAPGQAVAFAGGESPELGAIIAVEGGPGAWEFTGATPTGLVHKGPLSDWQVVT